MPRRVLGALLACMLVGAVLRFTGLAQRGLWEVDEATYTLGARAYVHLFAARSVAAARGVDVHDRTAMRAVMAEVYPMDYDFRYRFTRGRAREDKLMSGFRTWGKPAFCAAVVGATWLLGPDSTLPALVVSALAGSVLVGLIGWAAWRLTYGPWAAVAAAAWAATSLVLVHYSRAGYAAMLWTLFFAAILVSGLRAWRVLSPGVSVGPTVVRGALTGGMLSAFYGMLPVAGLVGILEVLWCWRRRRAGAAWVRHAVAWGIALLLPLLCWELLGLWRRNYLHGVLGFENVYTYFGEIVDQLSNEVEVTPHSIAATIRFWFVNALGMEGVPACLAALGGAVALLPRFRQRDPGAVAVLGLGACWLVACTVARQHMGRIYTPLFPVMGLLIGVGVQRLAVRSRTAAAGAVALLAAYGLWNVQPLLAARTGLPAAAAWIEAYPGPNRVAIATFGYNQLFRAALDRPVANPPTRTLLGRTADLYVDVGSLGSRFTERTVGLTPVAVFQEPILGFPPARLDLAGVADPWWRFRFDRAAWERLRGRDPRPPAARLIRIYRVEQML